MLDSTELVKRKVDEVLDQLCKDKNRYRYIPSSVVFDFLPKKNSKHDPTTFFMLHFRIVRFKIAEDTYETILTNLDPLTFPQKELKKLYNMRWRSRVPRAPSGGLQMMATGRKVGCWICNRMRVSNTGTLFFVGISLPKLIVNRYHDQIFVRNAEKHHGINFPWCFLHGDPYGNRSNQAALAVQPSGGECPPGTRI